jgi:glycosyltransferase involved in cell wall biosynthesis
VASSLSGGFDVIFNHFTPLGAYLDPVVPEVVFVHSTMLAMARHAGSLAEQVMRGTVAARVERRVLERAARVICVNHHTLEEVRTGYDLPRDKLEVVGSGVDCGRFRPPAEPRDGLAGRLLCVGRLVPLKAIDRAIRALAEARAAGFELSLTIAGDGPERSALEALARRSGVTESVRFAGFLGDEALIGEYQRADLLLFLSEHEGMPLTVLEAHAAGLPILASRFPGAEQLITDGVTGRLLPPGAEGAGRELTELLTDPERLRAMGRAARAHATAEFSWDSRIDRIETVLAGCVAQRG